MERKWILYKHTTRRQYCNTTTRTTQKYWPHGNTELPAIRQAVLYCNMTVCAIQKYQQYQNAAIPMLRCVKPFCKMTTPVTSLQYIFVASKIEYVTYNKSLACKPIPIICKMNVYLQYCNTLNFSLVHAISSPAVMLPSSRLINIAIHAIYNYEQYDNIARNYILQE